MVRRSFGGLSRLTRPLCLMMNQRPFFNARLDGRVRDVCNRVRIGVGLSERTPMAEALVHFRDFLLGGSMVDSTGNAGRLSGFLSQGLAREWRTAGERCRSTYVLILGIGKACNTGGVLGATTRGETSVAVTYGDGQIFTRRPLRFLTFLQRNRRRSSDSRYNGRILA